MKKAFIWLCWLLILSCLMSACGLGKKVGTNPAENTTDETELASGLSTDTSTSADAAQSKEILCGQLDMMWLESLNHLEEEAEWVIYGTVLEKSYEMRSLGYTWSDEEPYVLVPMEEEIVTLTKVQIQEVYKGEISFDVIEVLQYGGETETQIITYAENAELEVGKEYVMYLSASQKQESEAWLVGEWQGVFEASGNELIRRDGLFNLTFDDLNEMKQELTELVPVEKEIVELKVERLSYDNLQKLTDSADWIVYGSVIAQRYEWNPVSPAVPDSAEMPYTVTTIRVAEVYKGEITSDTIEILEMGGETDTEIYCYDAYASFELYSTYVVYLNALESTGQNVGFLKGHNQGRYLVEDGQLIADVDTEGVSGFDITLTELNELKAELMEESNETE